MFSIDYGWEFMKSYHYTRYIDGEKFEAFIHEYFLSMLKNSLNPKVKVFFQDGDPSHNSVLVK